MPTEWDNTQRAATLLRYTKQAVLEQAARVDAAREAYETEEREYCSRVTRVNRARQLVDDALDADTRKVPRVRA